MSTQADVIVRVCACAGVHSSMGRILVSRDGEERAGVGRGWRSDGDGWLA